MLLSGLYLWMPKVWNVTSMKARGLFRRRLAGRAREWNWHNVIGIWTAVPLLFIVVTGVIISYPWASNLLYKMTGTQPPVGGWRGDRDQRRGGSNRQRPAIPAKYRSLDDLAAVAKAQVPVWKSLTIEIPGPEDPALNVSIDKSIEGQPEQVSQLTINRQNGRIEAIRGFSDNNAGRKLRAGARFLHTGEEFGLAGETVAAGACLGAVVLVWTGLSMAIHRAAAYKRSSTERSAEERSVEMGAS
jgi:uncharacterized iron-regulated membrane protein